MKRYWDLLKRIEDPIMSGGNEYQICEARTVSGKPMGYVIIGKTEVNTSFFPEKREGALKTIEEARLLLSRICH